MGGALLILKILAAATDHCANVKLTVYVRMLWWKSYLSEVICLN